MVLPNGIRRSSSQTCPLEITSLRSERQVEFGEGAVEVRGELTGRLLEQGRVPVLVGRDPSRAVLVLQHEHAGECVPGFGQPDRADGAWYFHPHVTSSSTVSRPPK